MDFYKIVFHFRSSFDTRQLMIAVRLNVELAQSQKTKMPTHRGFHCALEQSLNLPPLELNISINFNYNPHIFNPKQPVSPTTHKEKLEFQHNSITPCNTERG